MKKAELLEAATRIDLVHQMQKLLASDLGLKVRGVCTSMGAEACVKFDLEEDPIACEMIKQALKVAIEQEEKILADMGVEA